MAIVYKIKYKPGYRSCDLLKNSSALIGGKFIFQKKNPLQDLLSSLNAVISTNESTRIITSHEIYNPAYKFELKTTKKILLNFVHFS